MTCATVKDMQTNAPTPTPAPAQQGSGFEPNASAPEADVAAPENWNVQQRFIRIVEEHDNGMVELEFAVGEPELFVEMLMPRAQFEEFCAMQGVTPTHGRLPEHAAGSEAHEWDWSLHQAREQVFRSEPDSSGAD